MPFEKRRDTRMRLTRFLFAAGLWLAAGPALAGDSAVFILDASGSMWGRIEPQVTKIEAARDVMGTLLSEAPDTLDVGFVAYGHRRKGDCADIEVIAAPEAGAGAAIASRLPGIVPRGKTPISDALVAGVEQLAFRGGNKSVVLVSDGIETCKADPCAIAETLAAANVDLKIHVVGFDVDEEARAQLQCIADKGRGEYFTADSVFELTDALSTVTTAIAASEPVVAPPPPAPPATPSVAAPQTDGVETQIKKVRIKTVGTVKLAPASWLAMPPYYWRLIDPETGDVVAKTEESEAKVKPGTYQLAWRDSQHGASDVELSTVVTVEGGETVDAPVDTGLRLTLPEGMDNLYYWALRDGDDRKVAQYEVTDPVPVPAGRYSMVIRQSQHDHTDSHLGEIEIVPGNLIDVVADQGVNLQWPAEWAGDGDTDSVFYAKLISEDATHQIKASSRGPLLVAPGNYSLSLRFRQHGWSDVDWGEITVPETGFVSPGFNSGISFISSEQDPTHLISAKNLDTGEMASIRDHWGPFPLPPGRYQIDYKRDRENPITIVDELEIEPGVMIEAEM